jgi:hypothetical protein
MKKAGRIVDNKIINIKFDCYSDEYLEPSMFRTTTYELA